MKFTSWTDMTHTLMSDRLQHAVDIANSAAATAMEFFDTRNSLDISVKSPGQAVTEADRTVELQMREALGVTFPGETIVGEEFGGNAAQEFWTIDPIDGTANFVNGLPFWGVALGHATDHTPDLGVIVLPLLNIVVAAEGPLLFLNGVPHVRMPPPIPTISLGQPNAATLSETLVLNKHYRDADFAVYQWRCSAVSLAWVGLGQLSGHLHRETTLWDTVPGAAICKAAGLDTRIGVHSDGKLWVKIGDRAVHDVLVDLWELPQTDAE